MKILKIVVLLFIVFFLVSCSIFEENTTIRIEGKVTNSHDNSPICSASVKLIKTAFDPKDGDTVETLTNCAGRYYLEYVEEGYCGASLFYMSVAASGYYVQVISTYSSALSGTNHVRCTSQVQTINFQLTPTACNLAGNE